MVGRVVLTGTGGLGARLRPVRLVLERICGLPVWCARIYVPPSLRGGRLTRLILRAFRRLSGRGVDALILPRDFPCPELAERAGLRVCNALPLYRRMADRFVLRALRDAKITPELTTVRVVSRWADGEVVRAVEALLPRVRNFSFSVASGGEELRHTLWREYGLPGWEGEGAGCRGEISLLFSPPEGKTGRSIPLFEEGLRLIHPRFVPRRALGELPDDCEENVLYSVLFERGILSPDDLRLAELHLDRERQI